MRTLMGAIQRRMTMMLALLVVTILVVPISPAGAALGRPDAALLTATPEAVEPTPTPTPTPTPDVSESETAAPQPGVAPPTLPTLPGAPADQPTASLEGMLEQFEADLAADGQQESAGPNQVQAEGNDTQEIVAAPVAPAAGGDAPVVDVAPADAAAPADGQVPAEGDAAPEVPAIAPPPIETYGVNVVPSLGTAARPLTNPYSGDPLVLAPLVAGQQVKPNTPGGETPAMSDKAAFLQVVEPVQNVAAASLGVVQPSWFATTLALLVLLIAASYAAVLRRRGEVVPDALVFASSVRPADYRAARSVRPVDLVGPATSVRP